MCESGSVAPNGKKRKPCLLFFSCIHSMTTSCIYPMHSTMHDVLFIFFFICTHHDVHLSDLIRTRVNTCLLRCSSNCVVQHLCLPTRVSNSCLPTRVSSNCVVQHLCLPTRVSNSCFQLVFPTRVSNSCLPIDACFVFANSCFVQLCCPTSPCRLHEPSKCTQLPLVMMAAPEHRPLGEPEDSIPVGCAPMISCGLTAEAAKLSLHAVESEWVGEDWIIDQGPARGRLMSEFGRSERQQIWVLHDHCMLCNKPSHMDSHLAGKEHSKNLMRYADPLEGLHYWVLPTGIQDHEVATWRAKLETCFKIRALHGIHFQFAPRSQTAASPGAGPSAAAAEMPVNDEQRRLAADLHMQHRQQQTFQQQQQAAQRQAAAQQQQEEQKQLALQQQAKQQQLLLQQQQRAAAAAAAGQQAQQRQQPANDAAGAAAAAASAELPAKRPNTGSGPSEVAPPPPPLEREHLEFEIRELKAHSKKQDAQILKLCRSVDYLMTWGSTMYGPHAMQPEDVPPQEPPAPPRPPAKPQDVPPRPPAATAGALAPPIPSAPSAFPKSWGVTVANPPPPAPRPQSRDGSDAGSRAGSRDGDRASPPQPPPAPRGRDDSSGGTWPAPEPPPRPWHQHREAEAAPPSRRSRIFNPPPHVYDGSFESEWRA